jgi:hypothetical protein
MKKSVLILAAVTGILFWGCTKTDSFNSMSSSLKQSVSTGITAVNNAVGTISTSKGFEVLNANSVAMKSEVTYTDSVTLASVAGIYDFKPDLFHFYDFFIPHRLFVKTGTSSEMIVNLPGKLVMHPRFLRELNAPDSLLKNNFTIKASDYYFYFNFLNKFDYRLAAGFTLDTIDIGHMEITSSAEPTIQSYTSSYAFPGGYAISVSSQRTDTIVNTFTLSKEGNVLMEETVIVAPPQHGTVMEEGTGEDHEFRHREHLYMLTIGNVEIKRGGGLDSIQVFLNGVLQKHAGARIIDSTGTDGSIMHKRDILITFDDGTTTNLSTLLDPAKEALKTLVDALHSMNFAKNIVDYIAIGIDYDMHHDHD